MVNVMRSHKSTGEERKKIIIPVETEALHTE